jgi:hypothetical protein
MVVVFNISDNNLNGSIPHLLARFSKDSFAGNLQLYSDPLPPCDSGFFPPSPTLSPSSVEPVPTSSSKKHKLSSVAITSIVGVLYAVHH